MPNPSDIPVTYTTPAVEELRRQRVWLAHSPPDAYKVGVAVQAILDYLIAEGEARGKR